MSSTLLVALEPYTPRHRFGVNALAFSKCDGADVLYSASRDTTVRGHKITPDALQDATKNDKPHTTAVFKGHHDWVNDLLVIGYAGADRIASASSDTLVKIWDADGTCISTLHGHDDYVKALAHTPEYGIASAGLDNVVKLWDLCANTCVLECGNQADKPASVYAMDGCGAQGGEPYIVTGRRNDVVLWDLRTAEEAAVLRGHTDMVRCVRISGDAGLVLSGAADHSAMLFDLRMLRARRRFDHHVDSVWALDVATDWQSFMSGSRDGSVWHVGMENEEACLVAPPVHVGETVERVLDVCVCPKDPLSVWCCTTGSTIRRWQIQRSVSPRSLSRFPDISDERREKWEEEGPTSGSEAGHATEVAQKMVKDGADGFKQTGVIRGQAATTQSAILNDRQHVVTRDTDGNCAVYNVMSGEVVRRYEGQSMESVLVEEFVEMSLPSWFTCELRTGGLAVKVSSPSCFCAETFGGDAGMDGPRQDEKLNLGELFLHNVFHAWKSGWVETGREDGAAESSDNEDERAVLAEGVSRAYAAAAEIRVFDGASAVPVVQRQCGDAGGLEMEEVPEWVSTGVLRGRKHVAGVQTSMPKMCFMLAASDAADGAGLPKLSGPKYLRISKVKEYVAGQHGRNEDGARAAGGHGGIEIWCSGRLLPDSMSLATCAQFVWQRGGCVELEYRLGAEGE